MKRLLGLFTLVAAVTVATSLVGSGVASADGGCTTVTTSKGSMTAAVVDPVGTYAATLTTDCQIGVYFDTAGAVNGADISGATHYGVFVDNGASVDVTGSTISNIGEHPFNGAQHGVGIYYTDGATGSVDGNTVSAFQKNGIAVTGGANVGVTDNAVTGEGPVSYIAQNGIEFYQATGVATGNTISDIYYTGCSSKDAAQTGCTPYVATGLLLYDVDANAVRTSHNFYRSDQRNHLLLTSSSLG